MSVAALFRGKWGQKAQVTPEKQSTSVVQPSREDDDDEDDPKAAFSRDPIRRNSRFYRSMRKKRQVSSERPQSSPKHNPDHSPSNRAAVANSNSSLSQISPLLPGARYPEHSPKPHHPRTVLPSNSHATSRQAVQNEDAADKRQGRVGGRRVDIPVSSDSHNRGFADDGSPYRTRGVHCGDIKKLSEQTATACTVEEDGGVTMSSQRRDCDGADREHFNLRLLGNGRSSQTTGHSLNIIKNIAFLYQEYRDTSKQQEIEQRRQRDNLLPSIPVGTVVTEPSVMSPPALQLQLRNSARSLSLWQSLEAVQASGLLTQLPQREIIMQEAMFELVTSEASYYKSLEILESHFV